jgi:hypothetical protein
MPVQRTPESEHLERICFLLQHAYSLKLSLFRQWTDLERMVYDCADKHIVYLRSIRLRRLLEAG